jgi:Beta-lactamase enzyme family
VVASVALAVGALGVTSAELRDDAGPLPSEAFVLERAGADLHPKPSRPRPRPLTPTVPAMQAAWRYAQRRGGQVSLAVVDTKGRVRAMGGSRPYHSASVVKAMLLVAELRRLKDQGLSLDLGTADLLEDMITWSDNDAADAIYSRVGDPGLLAVADSAAMRNFTVGGYWGNAQVTAGDLARFFSRVRTLLPRPHRKAALRMLSSIVPGQRWGVPRAARGRWAVYFKGGWRATGSGELVHQAAWLRAGDRELAIAVLTDAQPSQLYAIHTVRGIADRLLATRRTARRAQLSQVPAMR